MELVCSFWLECFPISPFRLGSIWKHTHSLTILPCGRYCVELKSYPFETSEYVSRFLKINYIFDCQLWHSTKNKPELNLKIRNTFTKTTSQQPLHRSQINQFWLRFCYSSNRMNFITMLPSLDINYNPIITQTTTFCSSFGPFEFVK